MTIKIRTITIDCADLAREVNFWTAALGGTARSDSEVVTPDGWLLSFQTVPEGKSVKNRLHFDVVPTSGTRRAEVERLTGLGAKAVQEFDKEYGKWTVMYDPEGNEFCVEAGPDDQ